MHQAATSMQAIDRPLDGLTTIRPAQPGWKRLDPDSRVAPWTDDYADILGAIFDRKLRR